MATINQIIDRIKARVSRPSDSALNTKVVDELVAAQEALENSSTLPWFLKTAASFEVTGAHDTFSFLSYPGFIRTCDDEYGLRVEDLTRQDETLVKLTRQDTYAKLLNYSSGVADEATLPEAYYVHGHVAHIRKKQVVTRKYYLSYYKKDPTIPATDATTLWSTYADGLLMAEAGVEVAQYLRDKEAMGLFSALRQQKYAELIRRNQAYEDTDQSYVMDE